MIAISRKLAVYVVTAWVAITVNFLLPHLMPGNPVQTMIGKLQGRVTQQTQKAIELQFGIGLHQSLWAQYTSYWSELFHGNLGQSITLSAPVSTVLGQTLPWTVGLLGVATVISFALGTLAGIALGWRRGSWLDGLLPVSTFFQAVPYFFLGTVLLLVLGSDLHWFPVLGNYARGMTPGFNVPFIGSVLRYAELPTATIVLSSIAGWMLGMRNMMITVMDEDFVLVARAKGLPTRKVISYAARNAILPSIANLHPSATHWLGTSNLGADIFSQLLNGARATMVVGFIAGLVATLLSLIVGIAAGYIGGGTDEGLSLAANVFLAIPALPLLIVIDSYLPPSGRSNTLLIGVIISVTGWAWGARVLRAQTLSVKRRDFVEAARVVGEGRLRIMFYEVLPNLLAIVASIVPVHHAVRDRHLRRAGLPRRDQHVGVELGHDAVLGAVQQRAADRGVVVVRAARAVHRPGRDGAGADELRRRRVHQPAAAGGGAVPPRDEEGRAAAPSQARADPGRPDGPAAPAAGRRPQPTGVAGAPAGHGQHGRTSQSPATHTGGAVDGQPRARGTSTGDPRPVRGLRDRRGGHACGGGRESGAAPRRRSSAWPARAAAGSRRWPTRPPGCCASPA